MKYYKLIDSIGSLILEKCESDEAIAVPTNYQLIEINVDEYDRLFTEQQTTGLYTYNADGDDFPDVVDSSVSIG